VEITDTGRAYERGLTPSGSTAAEDLGRKLIETLQAGANRPIELSKDVKDRIAHEVSLALTAEASKVIAREVAYRFEYEVQQRAKRLVEEMLPSVVEQAIARLALVPVPQVEATVKAVVDQIISHRISQLVGGGSLTLTTAAPARA
jgi:hypothetical protein